MKNIKRNMVVYLLSRNDLTSMTHGKELAQAQHCGVQMMSKYATHKDVKAYIEQGKKDGADHFNTAITLETNGERIREIVVNAKEMGYVADLLIDPSYPFWVDKELADVYKIKIVKKLDNGKVLSVRKELTMGWLLGDRNDYKFTDMILDLKLKFHNELIYSEIS